MSLMKPEDKEELAVVYALVGFGGLMSWWIGPGLVVLLGLGCAVLIWRSSKEKV